MTDEKTPSDKVLDETPGRAFEAVGAVSANRAIRAALASRGYTPADHAEGRRSLLDAKGHRSAPPAILVGGAQVGRRRRVEGPTELRAKTRETAPRK